MNLTIKKKLVLSFSLMIAFLIGLGVYSQTIMGKINDKTVDMADRYVVRLDLAHRLVSNYYYYREVQYRFLAAAADNNTEQLNVAEKEMIELEATINARIASYLEVVAPVKKAEVEAIAENWKITHSNKEHLVQLCREGNLTEAREWMANTSKERHDKAMKVLRELANFNQQAINDANVAADNEFEAAIWTQIVLLIVVIMTAASISFIIIRGINRALEEILAVSVRVGNGDLRENVPVSSNDEIGMLASSYNVAIENSRNMMHKIQDMADNVSASSNELNATTESSAKVTNEITEAVNLVANEAEKQMGEVTSVSAIVQQISASMEEMAATASFSSNNAVTTAEKANAGNEYIKKAVKQMENIKTTVMESAAVVSKLGERSQEIGQIVDAISGIAGQTNLLALNAAIEAARAGEQGKGFAVVATEVSKLAEQSQEAAKKIEALIYQIQSETASAVTAMEKGTEEVKSGAEVVDSSGKMFKEIVDLSENVAEQAKSIASTINEVAIGTEKVVASVKGLDDVSRKCSTEAQRISAAVEEQLASQEEISSSSQNLSDIAQELKAVTEQFKV